MCQTIVIVETRMIQAPLICPYGDRIGVGFGLNSWCALIMDFDDAPLFAGLFYLYLHW